VEKRHKPVAGLCRKGR